AARFAADPDATLITTDYVLLELSAFFAKPPLRGHLVALVEGLSHYANMTVVRANEELFDRGWAAHSRHLDKSWSLVDCISFEVMRDHNVAEALTADHHFEQAGFRALLKAGAS